MLFLGWLALAIICGALEWRPHCFVFGPPNSGKTTLHNFGCALLEPLRVRADGQSTEAGIRQRLGADSLPVVMDEFETDQRATRLESVFRLARSASSAESPVLRGTPEGKSLQFNIRTMFFFSAINVAGMSPQDATRIIPFELGAHNSDPEVGKLIETERQHFSDLGPKWCGYIASKASNIIKGIDVFKLAMTSIESRHRQNMASLLSGAFVALNGRTPSAKEAEEWVREYQPAINYHAQSHERDDASECLSYLLAHPVSGDRGEQNILGQWISDELEAAKDGRLENVLREGTRILAIHDIKIHQEDGQIVGVLIRNGSPAIDKIFENTRWARGSWQRAMGQIKGTYSLKNPVRFPNSTKKHRCVGLPLDLIPPSLSKFTDNEKY